MFKSKKLKLFPCDFINSYFMQRSNNLSQNDLALLTLNNNINRISKADPRYRVTLSLCDRSTGINLLQFRDSNHLTYTTSQSKSILSKELLLLNQVKKRQLLTLFAEYTMSLKLDVERLRIYENLINKQNVHLTLTNFFFKERNYLNAYFNIYLKSICHSNTLYFYKPTITLTNLQSLTNRIISIIPAHLNGLLVTNLNNKSSNFINVKSRAGLILMQSDIQTLYSNTQTLFNGWFTTKTFQTIGNKSLFLLDYFHIEIINGLKFSRKLIISRYKNSLRKNRFKDIITGRNFIKNNFLSHYRLCNRKRSINQNSELKTTLTGTIWKNNNYINFKSKNRRVTGYKVTKFRFIQPNKYYLLRKFYARRETNSPVKKLYFEQKHLLTVKKRKTIELNTSSNLLYILLRLEEKIDSLPEALVTKKLIRLYNLIKILLNEKQKSFSIRQRFLTNKTTLLALRKSGWKSYLKNMILKTAKHTQTKVFQLAELAKKLVRNLNLKDTKVLKTRATLENRRKRFLTMRVKSLKWSTIMQVRRSRMPQSIKKKRFKRKKLFSDKIRLTENYTKLKENRNALGLLINKKINFFFINALALTKYAYNVQRKWDKKPTRSPNKYLQNLDRDLINRYKYVAIYIKDFIRVCFIGMFLKKPTFISRFIAFLIAELPRNRKETTFLKCVMKIVRIFSAERGEIVGLRIKFKGRVNRWRRTKALIGKRGHIAFNTLNKRIIYGTAHAINRKGAIGIGLWIYYKPEFTYQPRPSIVFTHLELSKESILNYIKYSQKKQHYLKNYKKLLLTNN